MLQCLKFILFCNDTLHVSEGLSVRHQQFKTIHTESGILFLYKSNNCVSIVKPIRCTNISNLFDFGITLHASDGLSVHHQEFTIVHTAVKQILLSAC